MTHDPLHTFGGPFVAAVLATAVAAVVASAVATAVLTYRNHRLLVGEQADATDDGLLGRVAQLERRVKSVRRALCREGILSGRDEPTRTDGGEDGG